MLSASRSSIVQRGKSTEAVQCNAGVVDDEIDAFGVRLLQVFCKILDARLIGDVQMVVLDLCETAICLKCFGLLQLRVLFKLLERCLASALVARGEVYEERTIVERRFGILEGELAYNG